MAFPHQKRSMPGSSPKRRRRSPTKTIVRRSRRHRGDIMSPETRSALMARIKGKNTGPERLLREALPLNGLRCGYHAKDLLGRPDLVFRKCRLVVFVDGDFWHGWRFSVWRDKLSAKWEKKIESNRRRDLRAHRSLRRAGCRVMRIWEHQIERDLHACVRRVLAAIRQGAWPILQPARTWYSTFVFVP